MPHISKINLQELITLVREIAVTETMSTTNPLACTPKENAELALKKERLLKFEIKHKLREDGEEKVRKISTTMMSEATHVPNRLLDTLIERLRLKNDAALSRVLEVAPPVISKIRGYRLAVGPILLISMHEVSGISIKELRALMGDTHEKFSIRNQKVRTKI